jgi:hypothetical protein
MHPPHSLTSFFSALSPAIGVEAAAGAAAATMMTEGKEAAASRPRRVTRSAEGARRPPGSETGARRARDWEVKAIDGGGPCLLFPAARC